MMETVFADDELEAVENENKENRDTADHRHITVNTAIPIIFR
jgi:hypothetical protein